MNFFSRKSPSSCRTAADIRDDTSMLSSSSWGTQLTVRVTLPPRDSHAPDVHRHRSFSPPHFLSPPPPLPRQGGWPPPFSMLRVNLYFSTARGVGAAVPPALTALLATRTAGQSATGTSDPVVASAALTSPSASGGAGTLARPPPPPLSFLDGDAAGTTVLNVFDDAAYHRTNVSLAGADAGALAAAATGLIGAVAPRLSLVGHSGTHPRVGVVDHVSVQPMKGGGG